VQLLLYRQQEHKNSDDYDENIHATNGSHISWLVRFDYPDRGLDLITEAGGREITFSL